MPEHADDLIAVLDHLRVESATVVGHSMGGFVAVVAADRHPERVDAVLLVDGGLPLDLGPLAQLPIAELVDAIIGPSLQRLRMTFASEEEYLDFWRPHPALRDHWNDHIEAYLRYDLVGTPPELRSGVREEAVLADSESDLRDGVVERAVLALRRPAIFLRAPRGLADAAPLFAEQTVARWQAAVPALVVRTVPDVNHFTITLTENGATAIAEALEELRGEG
jgi:pimeloyl-ACP methyl ester carboxylesterase